MAYMLQFLLKTNVSSFCYSHFFSKNTCELDIVFTRTVKILTTNELVKLTTLWTTGPCSLLPNEMVTVPDRAQQTQQHDTDNSRYTDTRYNDIILYNNDLTATTPSLKR